MNFYKKPVAFIRCGAGHFPHGSPLGLIPAFVEDPDKYLQSVVRRAVDDGFERIIISRPSGRYPNTPMHGADWYCSPERVKDAIVRVATEINGVLSLGVYTGSAFATINEDTIVPWSMGELMGWKVNPTIDDYDKMLRPWIDDLVLDEVWVDASSPAYRRVNFARWAMLTSLDTGVHIVGEAWPLRPKEERQPGRVLDPAVNAMPWFCLGRFLRMAGAKPNELRQPHGPVRYIAEIGGDPNEQWTREQIENWGCTWVKYYP